MPAAYSTPPIPTTRPAPRPAMPRATPRASHSASGTATPARALRPGHLNVPAEGSGALYMPPPPASGSLPAPNSYAGGYTPGYALPAPSYPAAPTYPVASAYPPASTYPGSAPATGGYAAPNAAPARAEFPDVWLIALATPAGGFRPIEGAGRNGAVRVSRPYGHLRALRPVMPEIVPAATPEPEWARVWAEAAALAEIAETNARARRGNSGALSSGPLGSGAPGMGASSNLPAARLIPQVVSAVEVETDAGIFRVERRDEILTHSDLAWSIANLESGEPDSMVPLPRRQLALLLTLLPQPEDPAHPEEDAEWGWAHKLRGPWERGPLHGAGKLGRLIAVDPDMSGRGMHRACFELLGTEEVIWAAGVPCFRTGSVYELVPLVRRGSVSRWLTWPLGKGRRRAGMPDRPKWEIARAVYRVGAPRWPLAGVVEPLGPLGVAG